MIPLNHGLTRLDATGRPESSPGTRARRRTRVIWPASPDHAPTRLDTRRTSSRVSLHSCDGCGRASGQADFARLPEAHPRGAPCLPGALSTSWLYRPYGAVEWDAERISKRLYDQKWDVCASEVPSGPSKGERFERSLMK